MSIARPILEAYWLGWSPSPPAMNLADIPSQAPVNVVKIAFYNLYPNNNLSLCFGMSKKHDWDYTRSGIEALQAAGIKVMASIIGTPHPPVGWNDIPDAAAFARNAKILLIDNLGFDGIDVDNEDSADPATPFFDVVTALRAELGPKGSPHSLLTYPTYEPWRDLPWLGKIGDAFDWVSTMDYGRDENGQIDLWKQYAGVLGPENVLIGVGYRQRAPTTPATVAAVAKWETSQGAGATGGMMLWSLSAGENSRQYYEAIRQNLTIWHPPQPVSESSPPA